jgi:hypothetical protein
VIWNGCRDTGQPSWAIACTVHGAAKGRAVRKHARAQGWSREPSTPIGVDAVSKRWPWRFAPFRVRESAFWAYARAAVETLLGRGIDGTTCLMMMVRTSLPLRVGAGRRRRAARHVIDVHRRKTALVVMRARDGRSKGSSSVSSFRSTRHQLSDRVPANTLGLVREWASACDRRGDRTPLSD